VVDGLNKQRTKRESSESCCPFADQNFGALDGRQFTPIGQTKTAGRVAALTSGHVCNGLALSSYQNRLEPASVSVSPQGTAASISLKHSGLPDRVTRWHLLSVFEPTAKPGYKLSSTAIMVFRFYILKTSDEDYGKGRICAVWWQVQQIARELGLSPRTINTAERELAEKGFVVRTCGTNGARLGRRDGGSIVWAAGINLAPAIERYSELCSTAEAQQLHDRAIDQCRAEIRSVNRTIRECGDEILQARADEILPDGRTARIGKIERLRSILAALAAALAEFIGQPCAPKTSDASEENCAPNIQPNQLQKSCSANGAVASQALQITPRLAMALATPEFKTTLAMIGKPTWPNIVQAASWIAPTIGIGQRAWQKACQQFGREQAALCVVVVHRNAELDPSAPYHARKPGGCLAGMMRKAASGGFNLSGLIHGTLAEMDQ
jgi:replication initiation protein RepC